jgi:hypothetical protein
MANRDSTGFKSRNLLVDILMGFIFLLLISFAFWLIWLTYFRDYFDTGLIESSNNEIYQREISSSGGRSSRFHFNKPPVAVVSKNSSMCRNCHEDLPHADSRDKRAFLNAHGSFMTCEICHIKFDKSSRMVYRWLDTVSGRYSTSRLNDKDFIIAIAKRGIDGALRSLNSVEEINFIMAYLEDEKRLGESRRKAVLARVHENVPDDPISCVDCHSLKQDPVLPLPELAYSEERINELTRIEVAGMVMKYEHFYLPSLTRETNE